AVAPAGLERDLAATWLLGYDCDLRAVHRAALRARHALVAAPMASRERSVGSGTAGVALALRNERLQFPVRVVRPGGPGVMSTEKKNSPFSKCGWTPISCASAGLSVPESNVMRSSMHGQSS